MIGNNTPFFISCGHMKPFTTNVMCSMLILLSFTTITTTTTIGTATTTSVATVCIVTAVQHGFLENSE